MVTDGERYLVTTTLVESDDQERLESLYYDGRNRYKATYNDSAGKYDSVRKLGTRHDPFPTPESVRKSLVWRYLSTENSSVTRRTARGETVIYRVVGTNKTDSRGFDHIWNYTVVAMVDSRGYVQDLTVEFDARTSSHIYHIRYEITYDGIGETTVDQPGWYETRAANATSR
jgi:hypothetical protein